MFAGRLVTRSHRASRERGHVFRDSFSIPTLRSQTISRFGTKILPPQGVTRSFGSMRTISRRPLQDRQSESSSGQPFGVAGRNGHADTEVSSATDSRHFTRGIDCARGYRVASAVRARWSRPRSHCKPDPSSSGRTAIPNWSDLQPVTGPRWTRLHGHRLRPGTQPGRDVAPSGMSTLGICRLSRRWAISRRASSTPRSEVADFSND